MMGRTEERGGGNTDRFYNNKIKTKINRGSISVNTNAL